ncbi:hypothetical protein B0H16DRAFT_1573498 [Mycena metata]|uniref:Uncharacterized protein n=1 Tax=Mycena metata TaxID=1033252 RepID=A0AAD7I7T5_9AGAR|nr:hypothetical protein B0H16DRAFT_1573498 [Mycena metata]
MSPAFRSFLSSFSSALAPSPPMSSALRFLSTISLKSQALQCCASNSCRVKSSTPPLPRATTEFFEGLKASCLYLHTLVKPSGASSFQHSSFPTARRNPPSQTSAYLQDLPQVLVQSCSDVIEFVWTRGAISGGKGNPAAPAPRVRIETTSTLWRSSAAFSRDIRPSQQRNPASLRRRGYRRPLRG